MWRFRSIFSAFTATAIGCSMFWACSESEQTTPIVNQELATIDTMSTCECFDLFANGDSLPQGCLLGHILFPNFNETDDFTNEIIVSIDLINECHGSDSARYFLSVMLDHCRDMPYLSKPESEQDSSIVADVEYSCEDHVNNCDAYYATYMHHLNAFRLDPTSEEDIRKLVALAGGYFESFRIEDVRNCLASDYELLERYNAMEDSIRFGLGMEVDMAFSH